MRTKFLFVSLLILVLSACKKESGTCTDGVLNQDETGIDCGGVCPACTSPQTARDSAIDDYNTNYLGSAVTSTGWTGSTAGCNSGTVPQSTHDKVIMRINYFRRLVGLNDNTTLDASKFTRFQETALMMSANGQLSHSPPSSWLCWTQEGADGAAQANLSTNHSTYAITNFINDFGSGNTAVGHRRWILHSSKTQFSYGTTNTYMALGVIGVAGGNTDIPPFIAYPPGDYIPQQLVFARWSFGIPGANFSAADVTMTGPGGNVTLSIISTVTGYGDNTIVWEPQGINTTSTSDVSYTVTVSGVTGASQASYTYTVVIIKP